jgi:hypothetical protein
VEGAVWILNNKELVKSNAFVIAASRNRINGKRY